MNLNIKKYFQEWPLKLGIRLKWWTLGDLNPRPPGCKPGALPS